MRVGVSVDFLGISGNADDCLPPGGYCVMYPFLVLGELFLASLARRRKQFWVQ